MGWVGSLRDLSKNVIKQGWVKAKVTRRGEGVLKVSPPLPPWKILIIHEVDGTFLGSPYCSSTACYPVLRLRARFPLLFRW